ncbi:hypothetical protein RB200_07960 [Streptomyces sp. PmtG]
MTEESYLTKTRASYDALAPTVHERWRAEVDSCPLTRATLGAYAELVRDAGAGEVVDIGC